jgi:hypothetical protein
MLSALEAVENVQAVSIRRESRFEGSTSLGQDHALAPV